MEILLSPQGERGLQDRIVSDAETRACFTKLIGSQCESELGGWDFFVLSLIMNEKAVRDVVCCSYSSERAWTNIAVVEIRGELDPNVVTKVKKLTAWNEGSKKGCLMRLRDPRTKSKLTHFGVCFSIESAKFLRRRLYRDTQYVAWKQCLRNLFSRILG